MSKQNRILFLTGHDKSALFRHLVDQGHNIVALVVPKSRKYQPKFKNTVIEAVYDNIPVITASIKDLAGALKGIEFDILLSSGYPFMITKDVFSKAKLAVNFHPALLPKHRGRYLNHILIDRDEYSGVTAHLIDEGYDTGPIIKQKKFKVSTFDSIYSLFRKSNQLELELADDVIQQYVTGKIEFIPQKDSDATAFFEKRTPEDSRINPEMPLKDLFYEIRAYDAELFPAFFEIDGQRVFVKLYRKDKPLDEYDML